MHPAIERRALSKNIAVELQQMTAKREALLGERDRLDRHARRGRGRNSIILICVGK
jgi:hypothetical protein